MVFSKDPQTTPLGTNFKEVSSARRSLYTVFLCWSVVYYEPVRKWDLKAALTITPIWNLVLNLASLPVYAFVHFLLGVFNHIPL